MTRTIEIGTGPNGPVHMDVDLMLRQGLYVQANSGGGKSWLLRLLAEQLSGLIPTFVFDVEGEFASLREKFPFFLVAHEGGDAAADPRTAATIVRKLLELRVSAVFDLFDLDMPARHAFMKAALEALDQAPRQFWGDTAILIDEAHVFAPEKGKGDSIALSGMAALATRGRKRGFGPCDATQRGAKFNKDVQSELKNAVVGLNTWEIDRERAREALGVGRAERDSYDKQLRAMDAGEFFVVGKAFGTFDPIKVKVGPVQSTHPEPGKVTHAAAPPPPAKIRAILARLGDIPKEAEREAATEKELRAENARLRNELATAPGRHNMVAQVSEDATRLAARVDDLTADNEVLLGRLKALDGATGDEVRRLRTLETYFDRVIGAVDAYREAGGGKFARGSFADHDDQPVLVRRGSILPAAMPPVAVVRMPMPPREEAPRVDGSGSDRRMLEALARGGGELTKRRLATLAIVSPTKSTFRGAVARLKQAGQVEVSGDMVRLTDVGRKATSGIKAARDPRGLLSMWYGHLSGKAKDALELLAVSGGPVTRMEIADRIGVEPSLSTFRGIMAQLNTNALIERSGHGFRAVESLRVG